MRTMLELVKARKSAMEALEAHLSAMGDTPDEATLAKFADLKKGVTDLDGQITVRKQVDDLAAAGATLVREASEPVAVEATPAAAPVVTPKAAAPVVPAAPSVPVDKGLGVAALARSLAATKGDVGRAAGFAAKSFGESHPVTKALSQGTDSAGGFLVPTQFIPDMIELLRARTVVRASGPSSIPLVNGKAEIPKMIGGSSAGYIGENTNLPNTQPSFGQITATAKKLGALVPISNDLLRYNAIGAEGIVRDDLIAAIALTEDSQFLRGTGSATAPKGLLNWALSGNKIAANATVNLQNVKNDLGKVQLALENANVRMIRPGWIISPRTRMFLLNLVDGNGNAAFPEVASGQLRGYPYKVSTAVPSNLGAGTDESEIYFVDFADVVLADSMNMTLMASDVAAYHDGSNVQAAFSLDQTVIRVITEHDLVVRHEQSIAVLQAVKWMP